MIELRGRAGETNAPATELAPLWPSQRSDRDIRHDFPHDIGDHPGVEGWGTIL